MPEPTAGGLARSRGHDASTVAQRFGEGTMDWNLLPQVLAANLVLVTNNRADFLRLYAREEVHGGFVVIVPNVRRDEQMRLFEAALDEIEARDDVVNTLVEVFDDGSVSIQPWSSGNHGRGRPGV